MDAGTWATAAWRSEATEWLDARLGEAGIRRTGAVSQARLRAWATVLSAPTTAGTVWLKAAGPATRHEIALYPLLAAAGRDAVLQPIAVDAERGWVVLPDGGPAIGERLTGEAQAAAMAEALPRYGALQRALGSQVGELLAAGLHDARPAVMPARFDEAMDVARPLVAPADGDVLERLAAHRPVFERWCAALAAAPGGASIDHNDLHPHNLLGDATPVVYDWGDSVVAHPFASMLVPLEWVRRRTLGTDLGDPRVLRVRDAYLEVFSDLAPHAELVATLELACRVAKVARALVWARILQIGGADMERFRLAPLETMTALLDDSYVGGV